MPGRRPTKRINHPDQRNFDDLLVTHEVIDLPPEPRLEAGALNFEDNVRQLLNREIQNSPLNRTEIAELLSGHIGRPVTKTVLDIYTGASRPNRLPVDLLPAITSVLGPGFIREIAATALIGQMVLIKMQAEQEIEQSLAANPLFAGARHA